MQGFTRVAGVYKQSFKSETDSLEQVENDVRWLKTQPHYTGITITNDTSDVLPGSTIWTRSAYNDTWRLR